MQSLKILEKPKRYITRDGRDAVVLATGPGITEAIGTKLFGVLSSGEGRWIDASWSVAGKFDALVIGDHNFDLVREV